MKRKIESLMRKGKKVYVFIHSEWAAQAFLALAQYEGFKPDAKLQQREPVTERLIVRLNADMTLSLIKPQSYIEGMAYSHVLEKKPRKDEVLIDFEQLLYK